MLNRVAPQKYFCGLDLGSQKIKAGLIESQGANQFELLGVVEHKTFGFNNSSITNLGEFTEGISGTLQELSKRTGIKLKNIQLGVGGGLVSVRESQSVIPLADREILFPVGNFRFVAHFSPVRKRPIPPHQARRRVPRDHRNHPPA